MFRNGDIVTLTDAYGTAHLGALHLPPLVMHRAGGTYEDARVTSGGYGVYTILVNGRKFRTEGRLTRNTA